MGWKADGVETNEDSLSQPNLTMPPIFWDPDSGIDETGFDPRNEKY